MTRPQPKGWCPGAHRPMASGDGLIVRLRPRLGRLTAAQVEGICTAAARFGSGILEVTSRANLQLRGVGQDAHRPLLDALAPLGLLDPDPEVEARRNILVEPFWTSGDDTAAIADAVAAGLADLPDLPAKFGFAIDAGRAPVLAGASADIRVERSRAGGLIMRPDGSPLGLPTTRARAAADLARLAEWFVATGGRANGRMARHLRTLPGGWPDATVAPAPPAPAPEPGPTPLGPALSLPFGQVGADALARAVADSGARAIRLTPWRLILLEGGRPAEVPGLVAGPGDPLMAADACPGAPFCPSASVETRPLARALAPRIAGGLHLSGCAKGCARARPAAVTLVGRDGRFDLVLGGRAWDKPAETGLAPDEVLSRYGCCDAPPV